MPGRRQRELTARNGWILGVLARVVALAATLLYTGVVVKLVEDVRDGRRDSSTGELFSTVSPVLGILLVTSVLAGIGIAIGFALLVIPALILLTIWAVIAPAIVVEHRGVLEAFGRSRELVRGNGWRVFGVIVVVYVLVVILTIVAAALGEATGTVGRIIFSFIATFATAPAFAIASSVLFFELGESHASAPARPDATPPATSPAS